LNGVGAQHGRARVLSFLTEEGVEPTNNRGNGTCARLRPAVIARKLQTIRQANPAGIVSNLIKLISPPAPARIRRQSTVLVVLGQSSIPFFNKNLLTGL
jgi:hypothetical protein